MRFISFVILILFFKVNLLNAQQKMDNNYESKWKKIDNLFSNGLQASAEKEILDVLKIAKDVNNATQIIKAMCYYRVARRDRDETARLNDILFFEKELKTSKFPVTPVLHSLLADLIQTYYDENRWNILDRTSVLQETNNTSFPNTAQLTLWTGNDFFEATLYHFQKSIQPAPLLKKIKISELEGILYPGVNTQPLRPTLYDFLVHRAIEHFSNDEIELTKPAYAFEIEDEKTFAPATTFAPLKIQTSDTISPKFLTLSLYQDLLTFHQNDPDPSAYIDVDIARLIFVENQSIHPDKKRLYRKALADIAERFPQNPQAGMANYLLAETYMQGEQVFPQRNHKQAHHQNHNNDYVKAKKIFDELIEKFPKSEAGIKAFAARAQIITPYLNTQTEKVYLPGKPMLALVNFKNIQTIYTKIVKLTESQYRQTLDYNENYNAYLNLASIKNDEFKLPSTNDYQQHATELKIDALPIGKYALIISEDKNFKKDFVTALSFFQVSNLAHVLMQHANQGASLVIVHRSGGEPLSDVSVKTWVNQYDYNKRSNVLAIRDNYTSDGQGMVKLKTGSQANFIELQMGDDQVFLSENFYANEYQPPVQDYVRSFLFTDRSIYRPGQTIYFKGILMNQKGGQINQYEVLKNRKTSVHFYDVNHQLIKQEEFTTNEYGSFHGSFTAPNGLLTGNFTIACESGQVNFNIEEYKRPKFEVVFDTLKSTYRLGDQIKLQGKAMAFAGNAIGQGTLKYRVVRKARFPYYWCFYRWGMPSSPDMEIAHGTSETANDGSFTIEFKAIPDATVDKNTSPVFDYLVHVDVTDMNGETRNNETLVSVAYQSLQLNVDAPEQIDVNDFNALEIKTTNLAGSYISSEVTLQLKKLKSPATTYRSRLWPAVDLPLMDEITFHQWFPSDEYKDENNHVNWEVEKTVWSKTFTSVENGVTYLQKTGSGQGWYVLEATTKDQNGEEVVEKKYIRLTEKSDLLPLTNEHLFFSQIKGKVEPGETASIGMASAYNDPHVLYLVTHRNKATQSKSAFKMEWLQLKDSKIFNFPIAEDDRGGFFVHAMMVKDNRVYTKQIFIEVPWTNKELKLTMETFRDKMLPGSEQEWRITVSGSKKEMVQAELLATLYDASLDAFKPHAWQSMGLFQTNYNPISWIGYNSFAVEYGRPVYNRPYTPIQGYNKRYSTFNWWGLRNVYYMESDMAFENVRGGAVPRLQRSMSKNIALDEMPLAAAAAPGNEAEKPQSLAIKEDLNDTVVSNKKPNNPPLIRSNFSETAFFYPQLHTDAEGNVVIKFKAPEALTRWKLMAFAHNQQFMEGLLTKESVTQKDLMVVPNTPRFLREGDKMYYSVKVSNIGPKEIKGHVNLEVYSEEGNGNYNALFSNSSPQKTMSLQPGESKSFDWDIQIPLGHTQPVLIKTWAEGLTTDGETYRDGEQHMLPVLLNSMLVTETLPLPVRIGETKSFSLDKLKNNLSSTLRHYNLTVEYTSNPAWYAIQSLPYLTDYPYECAEQTFNRYYANALASNIANSNPKIKQIYSAWEKDSNALLSNLHKNQELKSALLQETPWVLQANSESEQKRNVAMLFNMNRMSAALETTIRDLALMQTPNGGFTWFKGMPDDRFITQYIVTGIGRLFHLNITETMQDARVLAIVEKALPYLDARINDDYKELIRNKADLKKQCISYFQIQYLYHRSFFMDNYPIDASHLTAFNFYKKQAGLFWLNNNKYMQAMTALSLHRLGEKTIPQQIILSLRENAIRKEEMGMYWKEVNSSYWWYEAPIETQSLMIEAFKEVAMSEKEVDELKIWLLKNKQTNHWKTTKATADACYALLLNGTNWLSAQPDVNITLGSERIQSSTMKQEEGTGYFKKTYTSEQIKPDMGNIQVMVKQNTEVGKNIKGTTWGAIYWQYFENLDKITGSETPLKLKKQLFKVENSSKGEILIPISDNKMLKVGDKVMVKIILDVDRPMEYVHMKDMRGACFEPVNVLSNYKYQGGLGYYEATKDMATHFFFHYLQKGTYVFEYPMVVSNKGNFSNGIASIQCMYAPEFSSHSEGIRVIVK